MSTTLKRSLTVLILSALGSLLPALVKPSYQPSHVARAYAVIVHGTVSKIDEVARTVTITIDQRIAGAFTGPQLVVAIPAAAVASTEVDPQATEAKDPFTSIEDHQEMVAFLGSRQPGHEGEGLIYFGDHWHTVTAADPAGAPAAWTWVRNLGDEMWGTFNGDAGQLARMMQDQVAEGAYFPALPFTKFKPEQVLLSGPEPLRGVALADLDGDGRLDAVAASEAGCRVAMQRTPGVFTDTTATSGLSGQPSLSVSVADVDGDGHLDILLGGTLWRQDAERFVRNQRLPVAAEENVLVACFADLDGDGWPDVLVSRRGGGLSAWRNPGPGTAVFTDVSEVWGLQKNETGSGRSGFVTVGDWNADGRTDIFYSAGKGYLLIQQTQGGFAPQRMLVDLSFKTGEDDPLALTGASSFAALWRTDGCDLVVPGNAGLNLINVGTGSMIDKSNAGNEVHLSRSSQLATLAEDLNMDGNIDLFTINRQPKGRNIFHLNRGYGSYMVEDLYAQAPFLPATVYEAGQWGLAAGDADGDGATDLLVGGLDGKLRLVVNDVLSTRIPQEDDLAQFQVINRTAILACEPQAGRGVIGARITVTAADGRILAWRRIGDAVLTGCSGAPAARIAITKPDEPLTVSCRWSDGAMRKMTVTPAAGAVLRVPFSRP